jgi:2-alkyl-3-oxoalkanoate reductase
MKIGIVGCGLNSDYHINFAKAYPGTEIVGVVDRDESRARKCIEKYGIMSNYTRIGDLVTNSRPDVIHIVTPPKTHFNLAVEALEAGCHVLVEKPMAMNLDEAYKLFHLSEKKGVKICSMHNHFFDPCMLRARALVETGQLGRIINVESYYGLNTRIDAFRRYPAPNVLPWIYDMPGGVFHDFMAHPLYVLLPFVGEPEDVQVMEKTFGELPQNLSDELRILIKGDRAFGMVTFSFAAKPHQHFVKLYGTRMMVEVNFDTMTTVIHPVSRLPKAAQKATYNLSESWQLNKSTVSNVWNFVTGKLKPYQGMKILIHRFYDSVNAKSQPPVSKEDALRVIGVMDRIWPQVKKTRLSFDPISSPAIREGVPTKGKVLITGATGFLGTRLVQRLVDKGFQVRGLARMLSPIEKLRDLPVEIVFGDVGSIESLRLAFKDIDIVVHAAADTAGRQEESKTSTIQGTQNVLSLCRESEIKKIVYISSCSVYGIGDYTEGQMVTEASPLEPFPERRGFYSYAKLKAEEFVTAAMAKRALPIVCLRPGTIYGPGGEIYTPMMGFSLGNKLFAVIGSGDFVLPLVFIDNLCDAIVTSIERQEGIGEVFNVIDSNSVTKQYYIQKLLKRLYPDSWVVYFPLGLLHSIVWLQELLTKLMRRKPFLTRYRLTASQKKVVYDSSRFGRVYGWSPPITPDQAIERIVEFETHRKS